MSVDSIFISSKNKMTMDKPYEAKKSAYFLIINIKHLFWSSLNAFFALYVIVYINKCRLSEKSISALDSAL